MQQQLDDVRGAALLALRRRALRSLIGLRCGLAGRSPTLTLTLTLTFGYSGADWFIMDIADMTNELEKA